MTVWAFAKPRHRRRKAIHRDTDDWDVLMVFGVSLDRDVDQGRGKKKKGESDDARAQRYETLLSSLNLETHPEIQANATSTNMRAV